MRRLIWLDAQGQLKRTLLLHSPWDVNNAFLAQAAHLKQRAPLIHWHFKYLYDECDDDECSASRWDELRQALISILPIFKQIVTEAAECAPSETRGIALRLAKSLVGLAAWQSARWLRLPDRHRYILLNQLLHAVCETISQCRYAVDTGRSTKPLALAPPQSYWKSLPVRMSANYVVDAGQPTKQLTVASSQSSWKSLAIGKLVSWSKWLHPMNMIRLGAKFRVVLRYASFGGIT